MGDDGTYTMYVDAVERTYGISSTHAERYPLTNIKEDFANVRRLAAADGAVPTG